MIHPQCWPRPPTSKIWPWSRGQLELLIDENTVLLLSSAEGDSLPSKIPNPALGVSHLGFWFTVSLRGPLVTTSWMRQCMWVGWITMDSGDNCTAVRVTWYSTNDLLHIYCIINIIQQCRISTSTYVFFILSVVRFVKCWVGRNVLYHTTHRRIQDLPPWIRRWHHRWQHSQRTPPNANWKVKKMIQTEIRISQKIESLLSWSNFQGQPHHVIFLKSLCNFVRHPVIRWTENSNHICRGN